MRLTLVISSLGSGGAERVMTTLANRWVAAAQDVALLTFDSYANAPFYELDRRVRHIRLGIASNSTNKVYGLTKNLARVYRLRRAIRATQPDAVISFVDRTNILVLLATIGLRTRVIVSERIDPSRHTIGKWWERLRRLTYPMADAIVAQTRPAADYFSPKLRARARLIPNPVLEAPTDNAHSRADSSNPVIIAIGRLDQQKGFDLLLQAFARLKGKHPNWSLTIYGEGPCRRSLESLRHELGLEGRVSLPGRARDVYEVLQRASLFVLSSRYEGFPNALCEAMACGLAVISTDCPSGPREIIRDCLDGVLVAREDVSALCAAMDRLMSDEGERKRLANRAPEVCERFSLEHVMNLWEEALDGPKVQKHLWDIFSKRSCSAGGSSLGRTGSAFCGDSTKTDS